MKIGILSMQRVVNYGSFLQAYAMKEVLKELGHEIYFIDIEPGKKIIQKSIVENKENRILFMLKRVDRHILNRIKHKFFIKSRNERFIEEFFPILGVPKQPNYDSFYDAVVIGSDEVFNCTQNAPWGFAKTLLGEGLNAEITITYAASCGHTTIENIKQLGIKDEVKKALNNLNAISARDKNTKVFSETLTGKESYEHLDPTLIYNFDDLITPDVPEENYILIYAYDGRINDKETIRKIKEFAKKEKKQILSVGLYQSWCDKQILCTPFELLSYFKNSNYIVTDTFHGAIFSIKYNKQFVTIVRESNRQKLTDLHEKFKLTNRLINSPDEISNKLLDRIDFNFTNLEIKNYKESAMEYLNKYLVKK